MNLSNEELKKHYKVRHALFAQQKLLCTTKSFQSGHICGDANHLIDGVPTGSVRISVGYMTTQNDVDAVIYMITDYLLNIPKKRLTSSAIESGYKIDPKYKHTTESNGIGVTKFSVDKSNNGLLNEKHSRLSNGSGVKINNGTKLTKSVGPVSKVKLKQICVYPIKSCGAFKVSTKWELTRRGLKFDREWMIVKQNGVALTQKTETKLCLITPSINLDDGWLELSFPYMHSVKVPLTSAEDDVRISSTLCQSKVCGDRVEGIDCGDEVANWLSDALCTNGLRLIRQSQLDKRKFKSK